MSEPKSIESLFSSDDFDMDIPRTDQAAVLLPMMGDGEISGDIKNIIKKGPSMTRSIKPAVIPKTDKEMFSLLVQPKVVTYAHYNLTETQQDILTMIIDGVQDFIVNKPSCLRRDIFNNLSLKLSTDDFPGLARNKKKLLKEVDEMECVPFEFQWKNEFTMTASELLKSPNGEPYLIETRGRIITTHHNIIGTNNVILDINPWAIPYLIYIGQGVGYTKYYKEISLSLHGKYTKRIYHMLMDWSVRGDIHHESIEDFIYALSIPKGYDNYDLKKVLEKAKQEINNSASKIKFEFDLVCRGTGASKTKPGANTIVFHIINSDNSRKISTREKEVQNMVLLLQSIADPPQKLYCREYAEKIWEAGKYKTIYSKFAYYKKQEDDGLVTKKERINTLVKIIRDETGIDLRSERHRENASRYARRHRNAKKD